MNIEHFRTMNRLIEEADGQARYVTTSGVTGFSGEKLLGALQRLARYQESIDGGCYVEVGVYQGLTLTAVASAVSGSYAYGIDNFSQFDGLGKNKAIVEKRINANRLHNAFLINADYEDALENLSEFIGNSKVGTYFVDGPHDYRSQLMCLLLAKRHLSDSAVIVIDDSNYRHVRLANRDFLISNPDFKLLFEAYTTCHPNNMADNDREDARRGWWNGVNVIARDPQNILAAMFPPTMRDRSLYENEHATQSAKYGFAAPEALLFTSSLAALKPVASAKWFAKSMQKIRTARRDMIGEHWSLNTFSSELPAFRSNPALNN